MRCQKRASSKTTDCGMAFPTSDRQVVGLNLSEPLLAAWW
jgi:hypothetical protein